MKRDSEEAPAPPFSTAITRRPARFPARSLRLLLLVAGTTCVMAFRKQSYNPRIDPANFRSKVDNPYFPLVPGTVFKFIEKGGSEAGEDLVVVTHETKRIMGVNCIVVHDTSTSKGKVVEDSYDWYAQDKEGNVWYFGENTKEFKKSGAVDTKGSWEGGVSGTPGIIMPAHPTPGKPYRQEYSPNNAEDMGQIIAVGQTVKVPTGTYTGCVKTRDWSLLETDSEYRWYAKGVGNVQAKGSDGTTELLVSVKRP